jgi:PPOX class probable F420-dependent enzyme
MTTLSPAPAEIPQGYRDLLERPIVVTLVTLMPDGFPQASAVWFSFDGEYLWVNSAKGRQKDKNMRARPQVAILSIDPEDPYRFLEVRGVVDEVTEEGALDLINHLSEVYDGEPDFFRDKPERRHTEVRVNYKIRPVRFVPHGPKK